jgi:hypothetical protein
VDRNPTSDRTQLPFSDTPDKRLPYQKPALRCEGVFETMALSCAKTNTSACKTGNKTS